MYEEKEIKPKKSKEKQSKKEEKTVKKIDKKEETIKEDVETKKEIKLKADWISIVVKLLLLLLFTFLIIFIVTKFKNGRNDKVLDENIEKMRVASYNYFKDEDNRPKTNDAEVTLSLNDMIDAQLIEVLKDKKKNRCNEVDSNVSLDRETESKYHLTVYLECDEEKKEKEYTLTYDNKETENKDVILYEQKRTITTPASYSCPSGYTLKGNYCYADASITKIDATPKYKITPRSVKKAMYVKDDDEYEYVDAIVTKDADTFKCPSGYDFNGYSCIKTLEVETNYDYSCPSGSYLEKDKCVYELSPSEVSSHLTCSNGTLQNNSCYVTKDPITKCSNGNYDYSKKSCYKVIDASVSYSDWKLDKELTSSYELKSSSDTVKYVSNGQKQNRLSYLKYTREKEYSCSSGSLYLKNKCKIYDNSLEVKSCSNSYTLSQDKTTCYKYEQAKVVNNKTISCPSGYTKKGSKCLKYEDAIKTKKEFITCPNGYEEVSGECIKEKEPTVISGKINYSCPLGYIKSGTKDNTKCYKKVVLKGYSYCTNPNAKLENDTCIVEGTISFIGYKCPSGYTLSLNSCIKTTNAKRIRATKVSASSSSTEVIWSEQKKLEGWQYTGITKKA